MTMTRRICLECAPEKRNTIDICRDCGGLEVVRLSDNLRHQPTHELLQVRRVVPRKKIFPIRSQARRVSEYGKGLLRKRFKIVVDDDDHMSATDATISEAGLSRVHTEVSIPSCAFCHAAVELPCWYCIECQGT